MAEPDLAALQRQIDTNPRIQQVLRDIKARTTGTQQRGRTAVLELQEIPKALAAEGIQLPEGFVLHPNGQIGKRTTTMDFITDAVLPVAGGALGASALFGGPLFAGSAGGGALASEAIPGVGAGSAPSAALPSLAGSAPLGGSTGGAVGAGASAAGGIGGALKDFFTDPEKLAGLAAVIGGIATKPSGANTDELDRITRITEAQMRRADPLHQVATNLAFGRMPTNYRQGVSLSNIPLPE